MFEKLYTTGEHAKIFGVSYVAVKKWAYSGKIKYIKTPAVNTGTLRAREHQKARSRFMLG
jgi:predicted site-specific integrase-resolvase